MPDFLLSKIYRIYNPQIEESLEYVGSTARKYLSTRFGGHRYLYNKGNYCISAVKVFDEYGVENCIIELIENYPCADRHELHRREGELIRERNCVNKSIAGRTKQEYRADNKDKISASHKIYYRANKEVILAQSTEYYQENREKRLEQQLEYDKKNKDTIRAYQKAYREKNREKRNAYNREYHRKNGKAIYARLKAETDTANLEEV